MKVEHTSAPPPYLADPRARYAPLDSASCWLLAIVGRLRCLVSPRACGKRHVAPRDDLRYYGHMLTIAVALATAQRLERRFAVATERSMRCHVEIAQGR